VRPWPRLPRDAVAAPSLAVLKARLDGALSTLGWGKGSPPITGEWNWVVYKVPPNPNHSGILYFTETRRAVAAVVLEDTDVRPSGTGLPASLPGSHTKKLELFFTIIPIFSICLQRKGPTGKPRSNNLNKRLNQTLLSVRTHA